MLEPHLGSLIREKQTDISLELISPEGSDSEQDEIGQDKEREYDEITPYHANEQLEPVTSEDTRAEDVGLLTHRKGHSQFPEKMSRSDEDSYDGAPETENGHLITEMDMDSDESGVKLYHDTYK